MSPSWSPVSLMSSTPTHPPRITGLDLPFWIFSRTFPVRGSEGRGGQSGKKEKKEGRKPLFPHSLPFDPRPRTLLVNYTIRPGTPSPSNPLVEGQKRTLTPQRTLKDTFLTFSGLVWSCPVGSTTTRIQTERLRIVRKKLKEYSFNKSMIVRWVRTTHFST